MLSLARRNALDMLAVQPPGSGPYLLGGHSYGGVVAVAIALLLEEWGHDVGLVVIMDTPRPEQVREAAAAGVYVGQAAGAGAARGAWGALGGDSSP